ncbi:MAG: aadK, partial [Paenibacillus sp.]|nr:aadK [Paenibacillus sp.]
MRSSEQMMKLFVDFALIEPRVRLATLEGSRTNVNITPDVFQDYDISYFVTDIEAYKADDGWLDAFGSRAMMQKPEDMELFPPELGAWFSYIILFEDGNKLDLTLIPVNEAESYFADSDGLVEVLVDKDGHSPRSGVVATDEQYWIRKPTARSFDDCCNEFWMGSTYV